MALNGDIFLNNCTLTDNKSMSEMGVGGAIALRGASELVVDGSTITGNEATVAGGGIYVFDGESLFKGEGILTSSSKATVKNSTVSDNTAKYGADVVLGRFYSETFEGDKEHNEVNVDEGNTIGEYQDLTFTTIERTEVAE